MSSWMYENKFILYIQEVLTYFENIGHIVQELYRYLWLNP